jgi:hypothetical protein
MPSFDWITRDWDEYVAPNGVVIIELIQFLRRSGNLDEDSDWMDQACAWGARQSPVIDIGRTQDGVGVLLRKHS